MLPRLRIASLLTTLWHHPHHLHGKGDLHEASFERLLKMLDFTEYKRHPHGANRWPDFHLIQGDYTIAIELKSTHTNTVCMGGTWPHPECIYLISQYAPLPSLYIALGDSLLPRHEKLPYENYKQAVHLVDAPSLSVKASARTQLRLTLDPKKREEWYHRTLESICSTS